MIPGREESSSSADINMKTGASFWQQYKAIMIKSWLLKKRKIIGTILEILLPVLMMYVMGTLRGLVDGLEFPPELANMMSTKPSWISPASQVHMATALRQGGLSFTVGPKSSNAASKYAAYLRASKSPLAAVMETRFDSESDMDAYIKGVRYGNDGRKTIGAAILFGDTDLESQWTYTVRLNATDMGILQGPSNLEPPIDPIANPMVNMMGMSGSDGILILQDSVETFILKQVKPDFKRDGILLARFPMPDFSSDMFAAYIDKAIGLFCCLVFIVYVFRAIQEIVQEKEFRIREGMKMMGLRESVLVLGHFSTHLTQIVITSSLLTWVVSAKLFRRTDEILLFLLFSLFQLSVFAFCYLVSAFFTRARVAASIGGMIFLLSYFGDLRLGDHPTASEIHAMSLSSPICFGFGIKTLAHFESGKIGIDFDNIMFERTNISLYSVLWFMALDFVIYMALALYLGKVLPTTHGVPLKWWFPVDPVFWGCAKRRVDVRSRYEKVLSASDEKSDSAASREGIFEPVSDEMASKIGVSIQGLTRTFYNRDQSCETVAVDNMFLNMYDGQILSLVGHNGAGKTTVINLLCGMLPPTSGTAYVGGVSVTEDLTSIRRSLGVCPQHDILFPLLTVNEHLFMFGRIKGIPEDNLASEVEKIISEVNLKDKSNVDAQSLSGGQRRKLSVAIALMGDSKIVFLDEPTSGMDPYARRATWELIKKKKEGRVIVLTTHIMDEADHLGDRIAIMADGQVQCCGSSLFLKSRYGVGYTMTVVKQDQLDDNDEIFDLISSHVESVKVLSSAGKEVAFRLPFDSSAQFPDMFDDIDQSLDEIGVQSYSISVTTLEEVFLHVTVCADDIPRIHPSNGLASGRLSGQMSASGSGLNSPASGSGLVSSVPQSESGDIELEVMEESSSLLGNGTSHRESEDSLVVPTHRSRGSFKRHFMALLAKRVHSTRRDKRVWWCQTVIPLIILISGLYFLHHVATMEFPKVALSGGALYNLPLRVPIGGTASRVSDLAATLNDPYIAVPTTSPRDSEAMSDYILKTRGDYAESMFGAYFLGQPTKGIPEIPPSVQEADVVMYNTTARDAGPVYMSLFNTMLAREFSGNPKFNITATSYPLPSYTVNEAKVEDQSVSFVTSIAFAFIPSTFAAYVVKERFTKAKHLQEISGVNILAYWSSIYLWDFLNALVTGCLSMVVFFYYKMELVADFQSFLATFLHIVMYCLASPPFIYLISFMFTSPTTAQTVSVLILIFFGVVLMILSTILSMIPSMMSWNRRMMNFYALSPSWSLSNGLAGIAKRKSGMPMDMFAMMTGETTSTSLWSWDVSGRTLTFMAVESILFFILVLLVEKARSFPKMITTLLNFIPGYGRQTSFSNDSSEDSDVTMERMRLNGETCSDIIQIKNLRKVYNALAIVGEAKVAVDDLCFGVPEGQIFGFLGVNGAGKTTCLKMITMDILPTRGTALLGGKSILTDQADVRHLIGYCPQFDALIESLSARETLTLYARIKNVPEGLIPRFVDDLIHKIGLTEYADRPCGTYSGGNKRKLSVGIALIGNPRICLLDEPSTGMDPRSRRFMWNLISSTMKDRSVILTTHMMEECQALCHRIGIMVDGRLKCLGSLSHLQTKFGSGYQLDINTGRRREDVRRLKAFVNRTFPDATLLEIHGSNVKYRIPKLNTSLGKVFRVIEDNKENVNIVNYCVSEITLEQIFIHFARKQIDATAVAGVHA
eukprot:219442_1